VEDICGLYYDVFDNIIVEVICGGYLWGGVEDIASRSLCTRDPNRDPIPDSCVA